MRISSLVIVSLLSIVSGACSSKAESKEETPALRPAPVTPQGGSAEVKPAPVPEAPPTKPPEGHTGTPDDEKGDKSDTEWVPAEFKKGQARWKDTGVYVDGKPVAFLTFGELPLTLQPTWVKDKVSDRKRPGTNDPGWRWARQRMYKWTDYFKALGIDVRTIKEVHVYGPRETNTLIVTQKDLQRPDTDGFMFRFGANTEGKAIAVTPGRYGNGNVADKVASVMIYVKKKPPTLVPREGFVLDGDPVEGVPYYGEPIRGGIRIYLDNKLATIIKRQELDPKKATKGADGQLRWKLADVFSAGGVDTSKVVEAWVIRDERRAEKFPAAELAGMTFAATAKAKTKGGGIWLTDKSIRANALALHTKAVTPAELPQITPDDE